MENDSPSGSSFQEGEYISSIVFIDMPRMKGLVENDEGKLVEYNGADFLATVTRRQDQEEGFWYLEYRTRYKLDNRIFGSSDVKNWYAGENTVPKSEGECTEDVLAIANRLASVNPGSQLWAVPVHGGVERFLEIAQSGKYPFMHAARISVDDQSQITPEVLDKIEAERREREWWEAR